MQVLQVLLQLMSGDVYGLMGSNASGSLVHTLYKYEDTGGGVYVPSDPLVSIQLTSGTLIHCILILV